MLRIVHLLLFGLVTLVKCDEEAATSTDSATFEYDFARIGVGANEKEAFDNYGVVFNNLEFEQEMGESDKLTFVYVIDTQQMQGGQNEAIHNEIVSPVAKDMKGYFRFYLFDCAHPSMTDDLKQRRFAACDPAKNPSASPVFNLFVPPTMKKNPYTGEPMQRQVVGYPQNAQISKPLFKKWVSSYLPDFTLKIESRKQFDQLTRSEDDINKVMLFTKKNVVAPVLKAVSAEYSNRLRFYIVPISDNASQDLLDLKDEFSVTDMPTLLVQQTYDVEFDKINKDRTLVPFGSKQYKYADLAGFFKKYARATPKEESIEAAQEKVEQEAAAKQGTDSSTPAFEEVTPADFTKVILDNVEAQLVYFTALSADSDIAEEFKYIKKLARELRGPVKLSVCRLDASTDTFEADKKQLRVSGSLKVGKPELHFYPNQLQGAEKLDKSINVLFEKDDAKFKQVFEEIHDGFKHNIDFDIQPHNFNNVLIQKAQKEKKNVIYFMYNGDEEITLAFKHLSNHALFNTNDDSYFMALRDPPLEQFNGLTKEMMPTIGVVPKLSDEFTEGQINQETLSGKIHYEALLAQIIRITGKQDDLYRMEQGAKMTKTKRNFGEITSQKDFKERCLDFKKGCAIALLPAMTIQDYEKENFQQHVSTLSLLDEEAKGMPVYYSWVNITCHPEMLQFFEIDAFQVPTVVYYYPEKHVQANMIGMFAKDTIHDHEQRFLKGKLPTWQPRKALADMNIDETVDCSKPPEEANAEDEELYAEIMREMKEEEAEKRAEEEKIERELEEQEKSKKKSKKSGKKSKKKKGKKGGSKKEDL